MKLPELRDWRSLLGGEREERRRRRDGKRRKVERKRTGRRWERSEAVNQPFPQFLYGWIASLLLPLVGQSLATGQTLGLFFEG